MTMEIMGSYPFSVIRRQFFAPKPANGQLTTLNGKLSPDASIVVAVKIAMPAAVLAGGASRRMGVPKAALPYGRTTLLAHQVERLAEVFEQVLVVAKEAPGFDAAPARLILDGSAVRAPIHGLVRALEEVSDRIFILAVDLPVVTAEVLRAIAQRSLASDAPAVLPWADGRLQPLAAVWRARVLPVARERIARGDLSLHGLAEEVGAEILPEEAWRAIDPSGNSFANLNTIEEYAAARERA
jgi:molybdopterin-guanine dinucleotide biosynthesis protein A